MSGDVSQQCDLPGVEVHFQLAQMRAEREIREHPVRLQLPDYWRALRAEERTERLDRHVRSAACRQRLGEADLCALTGNPARLEPEPSGRPAGFRIYGAEDLLTQLHACLVHRVP